MGSFILKSVVLSLALSCALAFRVRRQTYEDTSATKTCAGGVCVPYYLCSENGTVITDGSGLIDIRNGIKHKDVVEKPACIGFIDVCCKEPIDNYIPPTPPSYQPQCGKRNYQGLDLVLEGTYSEKGFSQFGEFPWQAAILRLETIGDETLNLYICGGALIYDNVVLTAAHCVYQYLNNYQYAKNLQVRLGEWNTQATNEIYTHQDILVNSIKIHPGFQANNLVNDFALLFLEKPAQLTHNVDTVCLPEPSYGQNTNYDGLYAIATGWGKDKFGSEGVFQNVLKEVEMPIVGKNTCEALLRKTRLGKFFELDNSFMCAGGEAGIDTCKGDGGSPLVVKDNGRYVVVGVVAWGIGCGEDNVPAVYGDVRVGMDWINANV